MVSDHSLMHLSLKLGLASRPPLLWRLNESLLQDVALRGNLEEALDLFSRKIRLLGRTPSPYGRSTNG